MCNTMIVAMIEQYRLTLAMAFQTTSRSLSSRDKKANVQNGSVTNRRDGKVRKPNPRKSKLE